MQTFLRPLFEIRRFMFNQTTLYLDPSTSVADQCAALCEELESKQNSQLLRVHFTPSVFRAFADFAQMRAGGSELSRGFNRVYWMVIGGESLSTRDLELARAIFPNATVACNYAVSSPLRSLPKYSHSFVSAPRSVSRVSHRCSFTHPIPCHP